MIELIKTNDVDDLDRGYAIKVAMLYTKVYTDKDNEFFAPDSEVVVLYTLEVGPCIAFLASGRYYLDADDKAGHYFAALRHYSGGEQSEITEEDLLQLGRDNLYDFFEEITLEIGDDEDTRIVLHQLCFIGGQEKDKNCCGTEKEVRALETALGQPDPFKTILPDNMTIDSALKPECHFFSSHGEAFVDIYVQREGDTSMKISYELTDNNFPLSADKNHVHEMPASISLAKGNFFADKKRKADPLYPLDDSLEKKRRLLEPQWPGH